MSTWWGKGLFLMFLTSESIPEGSYAETWSHELKQKSRKKKYCLLVFSTNFLS